MADSKITALTSISTSTDPANDPLVIVDVSDTSMAASGTTKKVTLNNLLACSPTATLASATITGDLTVRTNQLVVNSSGSFVGKSAGGVGIDGVQLLASGFSGFSASGTTALFVNRNTSDGTVLQLGRSGASAADFGAIAGGGFTVGLSGSEWMRLNSTGLGVGVASPNQPIQLSKSNTSTALTAPPTGGASLRIQNTSSTNNNFGSVEFYNAAGLFGASINCQYTNQATPTNDLVFVVRGSGGGIEAARIDSSGNVGIGVTSPSNRLEAQEAGTGGGLGGIVSSTATAGGNAGYVFRTAGTNRWSLSLTGSAGAESIRFYDVNNSATRLLIDTSGNVISNVTGTAPTLATNSQMVFNLTSNTNLRISVRGTDGVTRTANITLA